MREVWERTYDRRGTQGGAAFDRAGAIELGWGIKYYKIKALIKLINFLDGLLYLNKILRMPRQATHHDEVG